MGHSLHLGQVDAKGDLREVGAIAGGGGSANDDALGEFLQQRRERTANHLQRRPAIALIPTVQQLTGVAQEHRLDRGRADVDAEEGLAAIAREIALFGQLASVALLKRSALRLGLKKGRQWRRFDRRLPGALGGAARQIFQ